MKKGMLISLALILLIFLAGCGKDNIQGAVVGVKTTDTMEEETQQTAETTIEAEPEKTASELLDELKDSTEIKQESKIGTFYGNIETTSTGKDALKEKTDALFKREFFNLSVEADRQQGPRYY